MLPRFILLRGKLGVAIHNVSYTGITCDRRASRCDWFPVFLMDATARSRSDTLRPLGTARQLWAKIQPLGFTRDRNCFVCWIDIRQPLSKSVQLSGQTDRRKPSAFNAAWYGCGGLVKSRSFVDLCVADAYNCANCARS